MQLSSWNNGISNPSHSTPMHMVNIRKRHAAPFEYVPGVRMQGTRQLNRNRGKFNLTLSTVQSDKANTYLYCQFVQSLKSGFHPAPSLPDAHPSIGI